MTPTIQTLQEKKLVGNRINMSIADNQTYKLWSGFMPRRKEITNNVGTDLYSMQVYDASADFKRFTPNTVFEKWAAVEVTGFDVVPDGMEAFTLTSGRYAVFLYKGHPKDFAETFMYIFGTWLPSSAYDLDNTRPHFEVLGAKYKNDSVDSEEDVWVPIKEKMSEP